MKQGGHPRGVLVGKKAERIRKATQRRIRTTPLSTEERALLKKVVYEGSPYHKRNPGNFDLTPPAAPRRDATLCDEANVTTLEQARKLFAEGIKRGLVSEATVLGGFPKQIWVVDDKRRVFEAMHGGSRTGCYHGYPIRENDPFSKIVLKAWDQ